MRRLAWFEMNEAITHEEPFDFVEVSSFKHLKSVLTKSFQELTSKTEFFKQLKHLLGFYDFGGVGALDYGHYTFLSFWVVTTANFQVHFVVGVKHPYQL